jgi:glutamate-5-semialdehyde dehydrogenase
MSELILKGQNAKQASNILGNLSTDEKNKGLLTMADYLKKYKDFIINLG